MQRTQVQRSPSLQGTKRVYLLDTYESAIALAFENAERNNVREGLIHLPIGSSMIPLPNGEQVNVIISNPAQLPLPQMERENSPFYEDLIHLIEADLGYELYQAISKSKLQLSAAERTTFHFKVGDWTLAPT